MVLMKSTVRAINIPFGRDINSSSVFLLLSVYLIHVPPFIEGASLLHIVSLANPNYNFIA
jgi:hypothetical protein